MRISDWSSDVCSSDLWCPPLLGDKDPPLSDWLSAQNLRNDSAENLTTFTHSFTHFDLELRPTRLRACSIGTAIGESRWQWISAETLSGLGLPAPIRKMRSEEHTSELQSLMRISSAVFCLKKKN